MAKFEKGQSGNPRGRPPGSCSEKTILKNSFLKILNTPVKIDGGRVYFDYVYLARRGITAIDTMFLEMAKDYISGDHNSRGQYLETIKTLFSEKERAE